MVRKIPKSVEEKVLDLWLQGRTYREIASNLGIALSTVNRVVGDARARVPDLDDIHALCIKIKEAGANIYDCVRGVALLSKLEELGLNLSELEADFDERFEEKKRIVEELEQQRRSMEEAERLANFKRSMEKAGVDPFDLENFVKKHGSLENQVKSLRRKVRSEKATLERVKGVVEMLRKEHSTVERSLSNLYSLNALLATKVIAVPCQTCRSPISVDARQLLGYVQVRSWLAIRCMSCGQISYVDPFAMVANIGCLLLASIKPQ